MSWRLIIKIFLIIFIVHIFVRITGYFYKEKVIEYDFKKSDTENSALSELILPKKEAYPSKTENLDLKSNDLIELGSWDGHPESGETVKVKLYAYKYSIYEIQEENSAKNLVRGWFVFNQDKPLDGSLSFKFYQEANCNNRTYKTLKSAYYSGPYGTGTIKETYDDIQDKAQKIDNSKSPRTKIIFNFLCSKYSEEGKFMSLNSGWLEVGIFDNVYDNFKKYKAYVDSNTVSLPMGLLGVWSIINNLENSEYENSIMIYEVINCQYRNYKTTRSLHYKKHMAQGEVRRSNDSQDFEPPNQVVPFTFHEKLLSIVCQ